MKCTSFFHIQFVPHADGCPLTNSCANKYVWLESEIGTVNKSYPCVQRRCGGTYSTGGQWEPVVITCASDYISCAISELEDLLTAAVNNTEVSEHRIIICLHIPFRISIRHKTGCSYAFEWY